ncbi:hypothetical protein [Coxiella-like endosymbiont of Rhipicephalus sanguineus]|uniref:hypothetical protein n=1 Tax=Coxiella-like endosymbiont of Rhipicephalus sanguineus TaxID=1955402 RepID=UPI00203D4B87|nr:hypothetical protein [Coxiella-like endosymbiont of Rhipicephalus sanguineus]
MDRAIPEVVAVAGEAPANSTPNIEAINKRRFNSALNKCTILVCIVVDLQKNDIFL